MHQLEDRDVGLTGKPLVSKTEVLSSNLSVLAKSWKGSLTGKAVVPKTTARLSLAGSSPVPSANIGGVA